MWTCHSQHKLHRITATSNFLSNASCNICKSSPKQLPQLLQHNVRLFSSTKPIQTSSCIKAPIMGAFCLLAAVISDPVISMIEESRRDDNVSYWKAHSKHGADATKYTGCALRKANAKGTAGTNESANTPPGYSRIVIVGGGLAGLHTALCLAERMADLNDQKGHLPGNNAGTRGWNIFERRPVKPMNSDIIVLEGSEIGNGASGRAKGLVVPGFQVPLENLEMNAHDYQPCHLPSQSTVYSLPSILRSVQSTLGIPDTTPRYSKAVANELYDATYVALDRLRSIVKRYDIDCGWVDCGAVEASIHEIEEGENGDDDVDEDDDSCRMLTGQQVNRMMGRQVSSNDGLYKWGEYDPSCAGVDPYALTRGLADAAEGLGVRIYEHAKVAKLDTRLGKQSIGADKNEGEYILTTQDGHIIHCDHVVLCTGAESGLSKRLSNSIIPIYTWMAATEPLYDNCPLQKKEAENVLSEVDTNVKLPHPSMSGAPMGGDDHFALNYWRNDNKQDGRLLFGSLCDTYTMPLSFISWRLRNALSEVYPHLSHVRFDHIWGGRLAVALNAMPLIGRDLDYDNESIDKLDVRNGGVWMNTGFSGHGIVPTALGGSAIANAILGIPDRTSSAPDDDMQQLWQLFHTYFPPSSWNGYPFSRAGAGTVFLIYNLFDWLGKKGVPVPRLPEIW